jgi:UDP-sulfoquinovose synthase
MRVFIAGVDGYLGWSLAQALAARGHEVGGIDLYLRRAWVEEMGSHSAIDVAPMKERLPAFKERYGKELAFLEGDLREYSFVANALRSFKPDAVVQLGECPSAPYSMISVDHAVFVQTNNVVGTFNLLFAMREVCPDAHLVKLGTMGEYGTPNVAIPEGFFEIEYRGRKDRLPFPRQAGSWYHLSKVHGSNNVHFACKIWGLRATDIMQGVVYGTRIDEMGEDDRLATRLDFDQAFGTVINRFSCQATIGAPLTLYGQGHQKRGFLPLRDSMQCLTLVLENPPKEGEYRVFNQFEETYDVTDIATTVQKVGANLGLDVKVSHLENPRIELDNHFYEPDHQGLLDLGYNPTRDMESEIHAMMGDLIKNRERIEQKKSVLIPDVRWNGKRQKVEPLQ